MTINSTVKSVVKYSGYASIVGLVTFLSTIFCTNDSFSKWKENHYYPKNSKQDESIIKNTTSMVFQKETLIRIDNNQKRILNILLKR